MSLWRHAVSRVQRKVQFENYYVAAVQILGAYDPAVIQEVMVEMEAGRHPDIMHEKVFMMDRLVSSIQFR